MIQALARFARTPRPRGQPPAGGWPARTGAAAAAQAAAFVGTADSTWTSLVAHQRFARGENCSTSFEQLLSRQPRLNLNMPQGLVARELLARGVEDFRRRCV